MGHNSGVVWGFGGLCKEASLSGDLLDVGDVLTGLETAEVAVLSVSDGEVSDVDLPVSVVDPELGCVSGSFFHLLDDLLDLVEGFGGVAVLDLSAYDGPGAGEDAVSVLVEDADRVVVVYE